MASKKQLYNLDSTIQKNDLTISYCSLDPKTNKDFFIKGINPGVGSFTDIFKKEFLTKSYKLSKKKRSDLILTPLKLINTKNEFLIIYPYLDSEFWQPLNEDIIKTNYKYFLRQICLIIDHLHECNLVHCDIKLSNFMYNKNTKRINLIDLDFISENQSKCNAIIKGTSEYITPDIIKNDIIDKTADYYALGISLEKIYMNDQAPGEIKSFIKEIKKDVFHKSIVSLLDLLDKHRLINSKDIENYKQTLFALHLLQLKHNLSHYHRQSKKVHILKKIFSVKNKIIGFEEELLDLFITLSRKSKKNAFAHFRSLILQSRIEKIGEYWVCYLSEIEIISITSQIYEHYHTDSVISEIKRLQKESKFYTVYLFIKFILQSKQHLKLSKDIFLKRSLAESCDALKKTKEAINAYLEILRIEPVEDNTNTLFELCSLYLKLNDNKKATEIIEQNIQHAHISFQLRFEALQNIIAIRAGNFTKAEDSLNYIIEKSKKNNIPVSEVTSYYYLSLIYHYQGNNEKAIYFSEKSIEKATQYKLKDQLFSVQTMIIFYYTEVGLYKKAISVGNKILKDIDTFASFNKKSSILGHLFFCYIRTGNYLKAREALFLSMTLKSNEIVESKLILFFLNFALLQLHEGNLNNAKINYRIVLKYESKELKKNIGSAYQGRNLSIKMRHIS
ncbi:MAG: protein kinase [Flavobacteriaceae bacterium]|nr:protein kinase [Flavobacteriaceae bacterium]